jgi:mRNA-degrading endonuclease RelE of RelBE toxin-antitoxin system
MVFRVRFAEAARDHLQALKARQRATVLDAIEQQLAHRPFEETRNRKRLRPNPVAPWELRIGDLRVFYDTGRDDPSAVEVLAIGVKVGNVLRIGGKEISL